MSVKISDLTAKGSAIAATDLVEISEVSGGGYVSKRVTGANILANAVPYTGATGTVDLGSNSLYAGEGAFDLAGNTDTLTVSHGSGSGVGLKINKAGNNEALYVNKTAGSGNAATVIGTLEATTLVKTGGTSTEFLMADGSTKWLVNDQTTGTSSSGTTNTITKSIALPSVPSVLNFRATFFRNSGTTNTFTARAYLSEVDNNIGGTAILIATITGANSAVSNLPMKRTFDIVSGNITGHSSSNSQPTDDVNSSAARLNLAIPTGTPLYLIFTVQCANASDSARFESAQINNFTF